MIHKRHDSASALNEAPAGVHVGDVGELIIRDVQQVRQFLPICGRLIQHDEKFAVGQHGAGRVRLEQVFDILADPRSASLILSHTLPQGEQEIGAVFMLEQQIDLVDIDPGIPLQPAVSDDAVEDAVQHHQHSHRQELLAKIPDIIAKNKLRIISLSMKYKIFPGLKKSSVRSYSLKIMIYTLQVVTVLKQL